MLAAMLVGGLALGGCTLPGGTGGGDDGDDGAPALPPVSERTA